MQRLQRRLLLPDIDQLLLYTSHTHVDHVVSLRPTSYVARAASRIFQVLGFLIRARATNPSRSRTSTPTIPRRAPSRASSRHPSHPRTVYDALHILHDHTVIIHSSSSSHPKRGRVRPEPRSLIRDASPRTARLIAFSGRAKLPIYRDIFTRVSRARDAAASGVARRVASRRHPSSASASASAWERPPSSACVRTFGAAAAQMCTLIDRSIDRSTSRIDGTRA